GLAHPGPARLLRCAHVPACRQARDVPHRVVARPVRDRSVTGAAPAFVASRDLQPVILGGDIGAYSLARTFHEAYGVRSVVVSSASTGLVRRSRILRSVVEPRMDDGTVLVATLCRIAAEHPG